MQISVPDMSARAASRRPAGWLILLPLCSLLAYTVVASLWHSWRSEPSLSHGPLVPFVTLGLLWSRRNEFKDWSSASGAGLAMVAICALLFVGATWADIEFL